MTFAAAGEPSLEAHANLRGHRRTSTANTNLLGKPKLHGELDLRGRRRTSAGSTRQASRPLANYLHGEHEPPRQAEVLRRARPSRPPANLRGKHTPTSGLPARTSAANTNLLGCKIVLRQDLRRERTTPASLFSGRRNLRMQNCARH